MQEVVELVRAVGGEEILDRSHGGRVTGDAPLAIDDLGQLRKRLEAVFRPRLGQVLLCPLALL